MTLLKTLIRSADHLKEFGSYFEELPINRHTIHSLEIQRKEMERMWKDFKTVYEDILNRIEEEKEKVEIQSVKSCFFATYESYLRGLTKINELLDTLRQKPISNRKNEDDEDQLPHISVPPCDTEIFHGDYKSWPTFRDMFTALYRNNKRLSSVEKMCHLLKKTQGEARDLLKTCPITNDGFEMAWKNLVNRYENKRVLVNAQLKCLFNIPAVTKETGPNIRNLQRTINDCITNLTLLNIDTKSWDIIFVYICSTCLPDTTLSMWEHSLPHASDLPSWTELDKFLTARFQTLESVADIRSTFTHTHTSNFSKPPNSKKPNINQEKKLNSYSTSVSNDKSGGCRLCTHSHPLRLCPIFLRMSIEERFNVVKRQKRCTNCLGTSHDYKNCKSRFTCNTCQKKHHSLLHRSESVSSPPKQTATLPTSTHLTPVVSTPFTTETNAQIHNPPSFKSTPLNTKETTDRTVQSFSTQSRSTPHTIILGTALVDVYKDDIKCTVRALIDSASEATFISTRLQTKLHLQTHSSQAEIYGLSGSLTATSVRSCQIQIGSPIDNTFKINTNALIVKKLTNKLPCYPLSSLRDNQFSHLQLADPDRRGNAEIDLLLGGDIYPKIIQNGVQWDEQQTLIAQKTVFGWIITGRVISNSHSNTYQSFFNEIILSQQIQQFWELENVPQMPKSSPEDSYCEKLYKTTTFRNDEGRFVVSLPFKQEYPENLNIGPSRNIAISQFLRNETRLLKNPSLKADYDRVITEYSTLGQMTKINPPSNETYTYYLPHHAVIKPDSTTTKLRVVFNASSPSANGLSLNDILYPGPVLQMDLTVLLLRWRLFRYVFNADIEKMYRQILVNSTHTPYQRIIFRELPTEPLIDFELKTVTFGVNCAPYLAIRTLQQLALECESAYPQVSNILRNFMYVDDVLAGAHTLSSALRARDELITVLKSAGFSLRKWTANNDYLLKNIPKNDLLDEEFLRLSNSSLAKTLGLRWNAGGDYFYFKLKSCPDKNLTTKRSVLSEIAKLFDPAGWLSPKIIVAKIIMQQVWRDKTEWDEDLHPSTLKQWQAFVEDYNDIEKIKIPRFVDFDPSYNIELHGFCDASEKAYAATLYLRAENAGYISTHLLVAKTKVAPIKFLSLPRKELCGAELMATMIDTIQSQLDLRDYKLYLWTDSTIVLAWLQKPPSSWKTFVANRVSNIIDKVGYDSWAHVESKDNPADLASRGLTFSQLSSNELWWYGPSWLRRPRTEWPSRVFTGRTDEEARIVRVHTIQIGNDDILKDFSDLPRALRIITYVFRFYHRLKRNDQYNTSNKVELTSAELNFTRSRLIIVCQAHYFATEYNQLCNGQPISRKSSLLSLNPFIDTDGIMRINGRLSNSPLLNHDERFPILLPYHARFTRLYINYLHKYSLHGQNALLHRLMRAHYYVPRLKTLIKSIISQCLICVKHKRQLSKQIMAALPPERTSLSRPFYHTGVDFAGPFDLKSYAGRGCRITKGYVLVFVCFATKAIHLEATGEISTQAFLAAFARFFSRRGTPCTIYSDNGTAFVGASNILHNNKLNFISLVRKGILDQNSFTPLEWHFIPPGAPHMGGIWEAGVKSFKSHLKRICNSQNFTYEEFSTMLARIEACLNSRPLSPMSDDPNSLCVLTPGHFLVGTPLLAPPEPDLSSHSLTYVNRWQKLKILHQTLARKWKEEYLIELHKRTKWKYPQRDYAVDDLVVIRQENLPPNQWRFGRIVKVFPGSDKKVRVAEIRTASGVVTRPITKLVLLPNSSQQ